MKKQRGIAFALLIAIAMIGSFYILLPSQPEITGMSPMREGRGTIIFTPVCGNNVTNPGEECDPPGNTNQCPGNLACTADCKCPPVGGRPPSGGNQQFFETPCPPAAKHWTDGSQAGLLFADYDPEITNAEIVITVLDNNKGDNLKAIFINRDCQKITEVNLGEEHPNKIFTLKPAKYVDQPAKIIIQSVDKTHTINNPIVGKMYTKGTAMNLLGIISRKPWRSKVEPLEELSFTNNEWARLPDKAYSAQLEGEYYMANIFEPGKNIAVKLGYKPTTITAACAGTTKLPDAQVLVQTTEKELTIKAYTLGEGYGTGAFSSLTEGPDRIIFGNKKAGRFVGNAGIPDSRPQSIFATVGAIQKYPEGTIEDQLLITNIDEEAATVQVKYFNGATCSQTLKELNVPGQESRILKVSDMTGTTSQGVFVISSNERNLIVEKYGVNEDGKIVYKLNALAPYRTSSEKGIRHLLRSAPRKFMSSVPAALEDEDFKIKLINLPALEDANKIRQELTLHVTDGKDNWRTFELKKTGCVIEVTKEDLQEWAYTRTWLTRPQHLAIFGEWEGPIYPSDTITTASSPTNDPGFMIGQEAGNCCTDGDCENRWNLRGASCQADAYFGENVCTTTEVQREQAKLEEKPLPPPPSIERPMPTQKPQALITIPYTKYSFPWWYFILAAITMLGLASILLRKASQKPKKRRKK